MSDADLFINSLRIVPGSSNDKQTWNHGTAKKHMTDTDENILATEGKYYILGKLIVECKNDN